jgi:hypothetical protein
VRGLRTHASPISNGWARLCSHETTGKLAIARPRVSSFSTRAHESCRVSRDARFERTRCRVRARSRRRTSRSTGRAGKQGEWAVLLGSSVCFSAEGPWLRGEGPSFELEGLWCGGDGPSFQLEASSLPLEGPSFHLEGPSFQSERARYYREGRPSNWKDPVTARSDFGANQYVLLPRRSTVPLRVEGVRLSRTNVPLRSRRRCRREPDPTSERSASCRRKAHARRGPEPCSLARIRRGARPPGGPLTATELFDRLREVAARRALG